MKKTYTDTEVIEEIRKGNTTPVLTYLYKHAQPKISGWIRANGGSEEEAQDIFQDSVLAFYRYLLDGKFDESKSIDGFLYAVGRNMWINRAKEKGRYVHADVLIENEPEVDDSYLEQRIGQERAEKIQVMLSRLGERCKELLTYSIFNRMSMEKISEKMHFNNANTAKTQNYKCKQKLIRLIRDNDSIKDWLYK